MRATSPKFAEVVQEATVTSNSCLFLLGGGPLPATTTTVVKQSLVRQGLPCKASPSRTTTRSGRPSTPWRRPMIFRSVSLTIDVKTLRPMSNSGPRYHSSASASMLLLPEQQFRDI
ncbi:hypothetical protein ISCGN_004997 [Ixodes scapularis]